MSECFWFDFREVCTSLNTLLEGSFYECFDYSRMLGDDICMNEKYLLGRPNAKGEGVLVEYIAITT